MVVDENDNSNIKVVDFGLSKILGPTETSTEPFGTLVIIFIISYHNQFLVICCTRGLIAKAIW